MASVDLAHALDVARRAAAAASDAALPHYERGVEVERKPDRSRVTVADRAAEQAVLSILKDAFPDHTILAEETGLHPGDPRVRWLVDPIDGTLGFTRGGQFWGSLIALEVDGAIVAGTMALPALGDTYFAARGHGCYVNDRRLKLVEVGQDLKQATLSLGALRGLMREPWGPGVRELIAGSEAARCYGDLMAPALVLRGVADLWLEAGVAPWDIAPTRILFEEAGGVFTTFAGDHDLARGSAIGATAALHAKALQVLQSSAG